MFLGALGEFFRGLAKVRLLLGELFRAGTVGGARWESFFAVWPRLGCCWANFFARERLEGRAGRTFSRGNGWRGVLGEFFRGLAKIGLLLGELFRAGMPKWRVARTLLRAGVIQ